MGLNSTEQCFFFYFKPDHRYKINFVRSVVDEYELYFIPRIVRLDS